MTNATWQDVPRGHYAIDIVEMPCDCLDKGAEEWCHHMPELLGYHLFERKRDRFVFGATWVAPGVDNDRALSVIAQEREDAAALYGGWRQMIYSYLSDTPDYYRVMYGKFTGKCGVCGRRLIDPQSKLRGIGPECRKKGI